MKGKPSVSESKEDSNTFHFLLAFDDIAFRKANSGQNEGNEVWVTRLICIGPRHTTKRRDF
jgi:hypothetical protein